MTEFGGWPRPPRWVWAAAGAAAVTVLAGVVVARSGPHHAAASSQPMPPATAPAAGSRPAESAPPWPSATGACGSSVDLPQIRLAARHARVSGTVLAGGAALQQVTLGGAVSRPLPGLPHRGWLVTRLAATPGADYALVVRCTSSSPWWVYRIAADGAHRVGRAAFGLLGGAHHAWVVSSPHPVLTPLGGGRPVALGPNTTPAADTAAGLVVVAYSERAGQPSAVELLDPDTGAVLRRLAEGYVVGAADHVVLVALPGCAYPPPPRACTLESIDPTTGRPTATFKLPPRRVPASDAVISPDGAVAAFELQRARPDPRFTTGGPPRDVAVLHLHTGRLALVPGLELPPAPGAAAGLAFTATGSWLLVTVNEGNHGELLAWRPGMPGPALVTSLPGPLAGPPPLLPASSSPHTG